RVHPAFTPRLVRSVRGAPRSRPRARVPRARLDPGPLRAGRRHRLDGPDPEHVRPGRPSPERRLPAAGLRPSPPLPRRLPVARHARLARLDLPRHAARAGRGRADRRRRAVLHRRHAGRRADRAPGRGRVGRRVGALRRAGRRPLGRCPPPGDREPRGAFEGYFAPVFHDGPFVGASRADLEAHDPTLLVRREASSLRRAGERFYVSVARNHGQVLGAWSLAFARELRALRLPYELWRSPRSELDRFWRATLPSALRYAADGFADDAVATTTPAARTSVSSGMLATSRSTACSGSSGTCTKPPRACGRSCASTRIST